jgi:hypothetical protein
LKIFELNCFNLNYKTILKNSKKIDLKIPQGILELLRTQWAKDNSENYEKIKLNEINAILNLPDLIIKNRQSI